MPRSSQTTVVWPPSAVSVTSMDWSSDWSGSLVSTSSRRGASQVSTRPVPSHPLAKTRARYAPPSRRPPSTSPHQLARREGSVSADHTVSISASKRSSTRTPPLPAAVPRVPRSRARVLASPVISYPFVNSDPLISERPLRSRTVAARRGVPPAQRSRRLLHNLQAGQSGCDLTLIKLVRSRADLVDLARSGWVTALPLPVLH